MTMLGKHHSIEAKRKIGLASKGRILSKEHKRKISLAVRGKKHHFFGKKLTKEHLQKISIGRKRAKGLLNETKEEKIKRQNHYKKKYNLRNPDKVKKIKMDWKIRDYKRNPQKTLARNTAQKYIQFPKFKKCEICNRSLVEHRHHPDYNKPLKVVLLCRTCHVKLHRRK